MFPTETNFIEVNGIVINVARISFVDLRTDGAAQIHIDGNSISAEGDGAIGLRRFFMPPAPHPIEEASVIYYGPHAFDYPEGPIYPNTRWTPHVCRPRAFFPPAPIGYQAPESNHKSEEDTPK